MGTFRKKEGSIRFGSLVYRLILRKLFFIGFEEAADLRFEQALMLVIALLSDTLREEHIGLTEEQMQQIMDSFIDKLPGHIRDCLGLCIAA